LVGYEFGGKHAACQDDGRSDDPTSARTTHRPLGDSIALERIEHSHEAPP